MIDENLMDILKTNIPELEWSVNFRTSDDNTGTVYNEGGLKPSEYEDGMEYPQYMVYIRSSNFELAKEAARKTFENLHKLQNVIMNVPIRDLTTDEITGYYPVHVLLITALSTPLRIGVTDNVMEYSVNIQVILRKL